MVFEVILNRGLVGKDIKVKVGNIEKFVKKNEAVLKGITTKRNWVVWLNGEKKKLQIASKVNGSPPKKKRIETGPLIKGKVVEVPDQAKGAIKQKDKNLTAYGKAANAAEPDTIKKAALKKDWTIVSDNCFGVAYMKALNKPYESPFFSMYIYAPDYLILLDNFDEYMKLTPKAQTPAGKSKYKRKPAPYPVIVLDGPKGPVEIHMAHEKQSSQEAIRKWESRTKRMNMDKKDMFVKMDSRDRFTVDLGKRFLALKQFPHKRLFVSEKFRKDFSGDKNVTVMDYKTMPPIGTKTEKLYPVPAK